MTNNETVQDIQVRLGMHMPNVLAAINEMLKAKYTQFAADNYTLGYDDEQYLYVENSNEPQGDFMRMWRITECCGASAKGCDGYIGCRHCYRQIDTGIGMEPYFKINFDEIEWGETS